MINSPSFLTPYPQGTKQSLKIHPFGWIFISSGSPCTTAVELFVDESVSLYVREHPIFSFVRSAHQYQESADI